MKKTFILLISAAALVSCNVNRVTPSGNIIEQERPAGDFSAISVASGINSTVTVSDRTGLLVRADDNIIRYIETFVENNTLYIQIARNTSFRGSPTLRVNVEATALTGASASGGSTLSFTNGVTADGFTVVLSGGSRYTGGITADDLDVELSGGSVMKTTGSADTFDLNCSGGSVFSDYDFAANIVDADVSGGSSVKLTVNTTLGVTASGGSKFYYKGYPSNTDKSESGGSEIKDMN